MPTMDTIKVTDRQNPARSIGLDVKTAKELHFRDCRSTGVMDGVCGILSIVCKRTNATVVSPRLTFTPEQGV